MFKYYVYELIDPRDGKPFYVGKGCGNRIDQHEKEADRGVSSKKCNKIRKIRGAGLNIVKQQIAYFAEEQDAFDFEAERIALYGKKKLCNVAPHPDDQRGESTFLSADFMRLMAIGFKSRSGIVNDYSTRPWSAALHGEFMNRFDQFIDIALKEIGFECLRDGVRRFGVELKNGG